MDEITEVITPTSVTAITNSRVLPKGIPIGNAGVGGEGPIAYLLVVGFHHQLGNLVEYVYPPVDKFISPKPLRSDGTADNSPTARISNLPPQWRHLPFLAVPDGAHLQEQDHTFFFLPSLDNPPTTLYGVACFRQVDTRNVQALTPDVSRNHIQKSVVVLSRVPFFGAIYARLYPITKVYFEQGDFSRKEVVLDLFKAMNSTSALQATTDLSKLHIGLSPRDLIRRFGRNVLVLFKALLLERRILMYGLPVHNTCTALLSLVSLIPGLLERMLVSAPSASPSVLSPYFCRAEFGLPLDIFHGGCCEGEINGEKREGRSACILQPYLSLEQSDMLQDSNVQGFLAGSSNLLCVSRPHPRLDVLVTLDKPEVEIRNENLRKLLKLTYTDRVFIKQVVDVVERTGREKAHRDSDGMQEEQTSWEGSDGWVRAQFELYLESFLATMASVPGVLPHMHRASTKAAPDEAKPEVATPSGDSDQVASAKTPDSAIARSLSESWPNGLAPTDRLDLSAVEHYNVAYVQWWLTTHNSKRWRLTCMPSVANSKPLPPPKQPNVLQAAVALTNPIKERLSLQAFANLFRDVDTDDEEEAAKLQAFAEQPQPWVIVEDQQQSTTLRVATDDSSHGPKILPKMKSVGSSLGHRLANVRSSVAKAVTEPDTEVFHSFKSTFAKVMGSEKSTTTSTSTSSSFGSEKMTAEEEGGGGGRVSRGGRETVSEDKRKTGISIWGASFLSQVKDTATQVRNKAVTIAKQINDDMERSATDFSSETRPQRHRPPPPPRTSQIPSDESLFGLMVPLDPGSSKSATSSPSLSTVVTTTTVVPSAVVLPTHSSANTDEWEDSSTSKIPNNMFRGGSSGSLPSSAEPSPPPVPKQVTSTPSSPTAKTSSTVVVEERQHTVIAPKETVLDRFATRDVPIVPVPRHRPTFSIEFDDDFKPSESPTNVAIQAPTTKSTADGLVPASSNSVTDQDIFETLIGASSAEQNLTPSGAERVDETLEQLMEL